MNSYNLKARVYPVILSLIPIIIIGFIYSLQLQSYYQVLASFGVTTALYFLFSQLGRDKGKALEKKMWMKWGGTPSTQLFRFSDTTIDKHTKTRYHNKLVDLTGIGENVNEEYEISSPNDADDIYKSWAKYLISKSRDTQKNNLLFQENINYGFRRNLFGLKKFAIITIILLMFGSVVYSFIIGNYQFDFSLELVSSEIILTVILLFWVIIIKEKWIKSVAFSYAERLIEVTENQE